MNPDLAYAFVITIGSAAALAVGFAAAGIAHLRRKRRSRRAAGGI